MRSDRAWVIAMAVCIRPARESDADDIARLTAQLGYDVATSALRPRLSRMLARSEQQLLMAEVDGRAAGWLHAAVFEDIEAEPFVVIGGLVVDANWRRTGNWQDAHGAGRGLGQGARMFDGSSVVDCHANGFAPVLRADGIHEHQDAILVREIAAARRA